MRVIFLWFLLPTFLAAQIDTCFVFSFSPHIELSNPLILPGSIKIHYWNQENRLILVPDSLFTITHTSIQFQDSLSDSILICYQILDTTLFPTHYLPYIPIIQHDSTWQDRIVFQIPTTPKSIPFLTEQGNLRKHGSIGRGITIGTNQDVNVQSDFRLEMEGNLGEDISIQAAITDANIPIQPDGTTQNIQDFDKVFIRLEKKPFFVLLGDYEVQTKNTHFMNFYRNLLGVQVGFQTSKHQSTVSLAVAKGKFHTNSFMGENGKQGPYQLTGKNGERLIVVLAGSEKVYVNGVLQTRGEDYIIDYNTGQITFTSKILMTNVTRIVVDFEYIDRNYTRSMQFLQTQSKFFQDRLSIRTLYARDADNPNAPLDFTLTDADIEVLRNAGDNPLLAIRKGADTASYSSSYQILYGKKDTTLYNVYFPEVYYYTTDSNQILYQVTFTYVGPGNGLYRKAQSKINGNIFEFVGIDSTGKRLGDYEPIRLIPLPKRTQILGTQIEAHFFKSLTLKQEFVVSDHDANRLSSLDDKDNKDVAFRSELLWQKDSVKKRKTALFSGITFQYVGERFQSIDRVYMKEYGREWNYNDLGKRAIERLVEGFIGVSHPKWGRWEIGGGLRMFGDTLFANRQYLRFQETDSSILGGSIRSIRIFTQDKSRQANSLWLRNEGNLFFKNHSPWQPGIIIWTERKQETQADTLLNTSFQFFDLTPYLRWKKRNTNWRLAYQYRHDAVAFNRTFVPKSRFYIPSFTLETSFRNASQLYWDLKMRFFEVLNEKVSQDSTPRETQWMQDLRYSTQLWKRSLRLTWNHSLSSQKTPMKEVVYVKVNPGMGQYEWIDANQNGVEELDEFQPSINPLLANYVRLLLPTGPPVTVTRNDIQFSLRWSSNPLVKHKQALFWKGIRINIIQRYVEEKRTILPKWQDYIPTFENDTNLVNQIVQTGIELRLFQNQTDWNLIFKWNFQDAIQNLTIGKELLQRRSFRIMLERKLDLKRSILAEPQYEKRYRFNALLINQQYQIHYYGAELNLLWHFSNYFSWRFGPTYFYKTDQAPTTPVIVHTIKFRSEHRYLPNPKSTLMITQELFYNEKKGNSSFGGDYLLLEGMQTGLNYKASIIWTQRLFENLQLDLMYDGRFAKEMVPIHALRTQVRAFF